MNVFGKIIGLIFLALIVLVLVNAKSLLTYTNKAVFNSSSETPRKIVDDYIDQINNIYTINKLPGYTGNFLQRNGSQSNTTQVPRLSVYIKGTVLQVITEYLYISKDLEGVAHLWIANTPSIGDTTTYVDMGPVVSGRTMSYKVDIGPEPISFTEYKYVYIINPNDFTVYSQSILQ